MKYEDNYPCNGCDVGWGSAGGVNQEPESCHGTCEKLKAWQAAHPKPIKDWTLEECADHCELWIEAGGDCPTCILRSTIDPDVCIFENCPRDLNLSMMEERQKPSRFTPEEVEAAKAIKVLFPTAKTIEFICNYPLLVRDEDGACVITVKSTELFQSLFVHGKVIELKDIIGEGTP